MLNWNTVLDRIMYFVSFLWKITCLQLLLILGSIGMHNIAFNRNEEVRLSCEVNDTEMATWKWNDSKIENTLFIGKLYVHKDNIFNFAIITHPPKRYNLFIHEIHEAYEGLYFCSEGAKLIEQYNVFKKVQPSLHIYIPSNIIEGEEVTVTCHAIGSNPAAKLLWWLPHRFENRPGDESYHKGQGSKGTTNTTSVLRTRFFRNDSAIFCSTTNYADMVSETLDVWFQPTCGMKKSKKEMDIRVICSCDGNPRVNREKYTMSTNEDIYKGTVELLIKEDYDGNVSCTGKNAVGVHSVFLQFNYLGRGNDDIGFLSTATVVAITVLAALIVCMYFISKHLKKENETSGDIAFQGKVELEEAPSNHIKNSSVAEGSSYSDAPPYAEVDDLEMAMNPVYDQNPEDVNDFTIYNPYET